MSDAARFVVRRSVDARWDRVSEVCADVARAVAAVHDDAAVAEVAGMVASELLENAVRYGAFDARHERMVEVVLGVDASQVRIEVASPVHEDSDDYRALTRTLAWIRGFSTAREAYVARVREIASGEGEPRASRMGLIRIAAEAGGALDARVEGGEDDRTLVVRATVPATSGS